MVDVAGLTDKHFAVMKLIATKQFSGVDGRPMRLLTRLGFAQAAKKPGEWTLTNKGRAALKQKG
jgi:hypothetical protein